MTARQKAARQRATESRERRLKEAIAQLPELKQKQAEAAERAGQGKVWRADSRAPAACEHYGCMHGVMKMANGVLTLR